MKKLFLATALLTFSFSANADLYIGADYGEDCAQPDISIAHNLGYNEHGENIGYYNEENLQAGLIHPAIYVINNPEENAAFSINEVNMLVNNYWSNIVTDEDYDNAISCGAMQVQDLQSIKVPTKD